MKTNIQFNQIANAVYLRMISQSREEIELYIKELAEASKGAQKALDEINKRLGIEVIDTYVGKVEATDKTLEIK